MPKASIIIRTKNEERWIKPCLEAVFSQEFKDFAVIVVDNQSHDRTLENAREFNVHIVKYRGKYLPGKSLNEGIRNGTGELIVMLSAHCIPTHSRWLGTLLTHFNDDKLAGVYGRQEPLPFTADRDKRDLWTVFQLDRKVQTKDCFFHNANSAIRRDLWNETPFSEAATNIEDRIWAKEMIDRGYHLIYEPEASVFHWHGIHQNDNSERRRNVVRIIEHLKLAHFATETDIGFPARHSEVLAVIPVLGKSPTVGDRSLLSFTMERALNCALLSRVLVSTDHPETRELAVSLGAEAPFLRPPELSHDYIGDDAVAQHAAGFLGQNGYRADWVLILRESHPFRHRNFLDEFVREAIASENEMIIPVHKNHVSLYRRGNKGIVALQDGSAPDGISEPYYIGNVGLGKMLSTTFFLQERSKIGTTGIYVLSDQLCELMIRNQSEADQMASFLLEFWRMNSAPPGHTHLPISQPA